jgi:CRISPR-associated protein Cmr4
MNKSCLTFIHTISPLHAGTGQGVGVIDLPIAREKSTNLPFLPSSTLKGTLRDECEAKFGASDCEIIFGKGGDADGKSGSAIFSDQKLLCLPVRSLFGTFAWITSPFILERFKRDCEITGTGLKGFQRLEIKTVSCITVEKSPLRKEIEIGENGNSKKEEKVILEDLDLSCDKTDISELADSLSQMIFPANEEWQKLFVERFCVVSDDVMNFLVETATEITARNVLNDNKTSGNLWYEESLPTETILSGVLATVSGRDEIDVIKKVKDLCEKPIQLGGNMTVGRGLCRVIIADGGEN